MKLKDGFITHEMDGKQLLVGTGRTGFAGMVKSNQTAAFLVDLLKTETSREQLLAAMLEKYDVAEDMASRDLDKVLETLRSIGALDE